MNKPVKFHKRSTCHSAFILILFNLKKKKMFSDDIGLVSETIMGQQNQLIVLCQVDKCLDLVVNMDKRENGEMTQHTDH